MEIIAHRGLWRNYGERNQRQAFQNARLSLMGTETDVRDSRGRLVISHDITDDGCLDAEVLFELYKAASHTLALNIKADGLQTLIKTMLGRYQIDRYFCFDMSVPDMLGYREAGLRYFVRESEYETINALYDRADGVWMDGFQDDTLITKDKILGHVKNGKKVCIVSPELHGREYESIWSRYRVPEILSSDNIILCSDYPEKARDFFYGKN